VAGAGAVIQDNLRLLLRLYTRPLAAMSGIIDEGSLLFSVLAAVLVSALLGLGIGATLSVEVYRAASAGVRSPGARGQQPPASATSPDAARPAGEPEDDRPMAGAPARVPVSGLGLSLIMGLFSASLLTTVFSLILLYTPAALLLVTIFEPVGSFGVAFRRDYGSLLACTLFAWAAAFLPVSALALALPFLGAGVWGAMSLALAGGAYFTMLATCAVRTIFGIRLGVATAVTVLAWLSFSLEGYLPLLASPFLLYWGYRIFQGDIGDVTWSFGARQGFKRYLQQATINPRDANAHYQLGLIHQHRGQLAEAIERFQKAVEIDPSEIDAHHQLGRIAHQQQRYTDAIRHFEGVVSRDDRYRRHEIWRQIGATYLECGSFEHARWALEKYVLQRPHDPEGLYMLGEAASKLGDTAAGRSHFQACLEAVATTPPYLRREMRRWQKLAEQRLAEAARQGTTTKPA
jgi:hypothetical protein